MWRTGGVIRSALRCARGASATSCEAPTDEAPVYLDRRPGYGSRRAVGFAMSAHHDTERSYGALAMAVAIRGGAETKQLAGGHVAAFLRRDDDGVGGHPFGRGGAWCGSITAPVCGTPAKATPGTASRTPLTRASTRSRSSGCDRITFACPHVADELPVARDEDAVGTDDVERGQRIPAKAPMSAKQPRTLVIQ